jgi:hypothetical protein
MSKIDEELKIVAFNNYVGLKSCRLSTHLATRAVVEMGAQSSSAKNHTDREVTRTYISHPGMKSGQKRPCTCGKSRQKRKLYDDGSTTVFYALDIKTKEPPSFKTHFYPHVDLYFF